MDKFTNIVMAICLYIFMVLIYTQTFSLTLFAAYVFVLFSYIYFAIWMMAGILVDDYDSTNPSWFYEAPWRGICSLFWPITIAAFLIYGILKGILWLILHLKQGITLLIKWIFDTFKDAFLPQQKNTIDKKNIDINTSFFSKYAWREKLLKFALKINNANTSLNALNVIEDERKNLEKQSRFLKQKLKQKEKALNIKEKALNLKEEKLNSKEQKIEAKIKAFSKAPESYSAEKNIEI